MARFLCDTCRYCHPSACSNPERPNAEKCKDYGRTGGGGPGIAGTSFTVKKLVFLLIAILVIVGFLLLLLPF